MTRVLIGWSAEQVLADRECVTVFSGEEWVKAHCRVCFLLRGLLFGSTVVLMCRLWPMNPVCRAGEVGMGHQDPNEKGRRSQLP